MNCIWGQAPKPPNIVVNVVPLLVTMIKLYIPEEKCLRNELEPDKIRSPDGGGGFYNHTVLVGLEIMLTTQKLI